MKVTLPIRRTVNLETGKTVSEEYKEVELSKEQIEVFCRLIYAQHYSTRKTG